jgi:hypothetical protein
MVKMRRNQLQSLYHFLMEDILWCEYEYDFEDFKQTIMHHRVLVEKDYALACTIDEAD